MPNATTLPQAFRDGGYQAFAVGKLHVWPHRARIGFDEALIAEEGRCHEDHSADDYELFLADQGYAGQYYAGGMAQNDYLARPWHLPEHCHPTHWAATQMCRAIQRRDPTRPAFWYLAFAGPHPPLTPLRDYLEMYRDVPLEEARIGAWARDAAKLPLALRHQRSWYSITDAAPQEIALALRAFYATATHIDHQLRRVIGTLADEGLAENTVVVFTSDHGDMLGKHGLWGKALFYESSAHVPLIIVPAAGSRFFYEPGTIDDNHVELSDLMPTLLSMADLSVPKSVEGIDLTSGGSRSMLYGEVGYGVNDTRMVRDQQYKLIYYPAGNRAQLFDVLNDPHELCDLADQPAYQAVLRPLMDSLIDRLSEEDKAAYVREGMLAGTPNADYAPIIDRTLGSQRGMRFI
jgi:arylsulfatase A-like enzyme